MAWTEAIGNLLLRNREPVTAAFAAGRAEVSKLVEAASAVVALSPQAEPAAASTAMQHLRAIASGFDMGWAEMARPGLRRPNSEEAARISEVLQGAISAATSIDEHDPVARTAGSSEVQAKVLEARHRLELLERRVSGRYRTLALTANLVLLIPPAAYLFVNWVGTLSILSPRKPEFLNPPSTAYSLNRRATVATLTSAWKRGFVEAFGPLFFADDTTNWRLLTGSTTPAPPLRVRFRFDNDSTKKPILVPAIEATATFREAEPFPWSDLDVRPRVRVETRAGPIASSVGVTVHNDGPPPAVDVHVLYSTQGGRPIASEESRILCHAGTLPSTLLSAKSEYSHVPVASGALGSPLFLRLEARPPHVVGDVDFQFGGVWYETIRSPQRLAEVTSVISPISRLEIRVQWESLVHKVETRDSEVALPGVFCFYRRQPMLFEYDPRLQYPEGSFGGIAGPLLPTVAEVLSQPKPNHVQGEVPLINETILLELGGLDPARAIVQVNQHLSVGGTVLVEIMGLQPRSGRYELKVAIPGGGECGLEVETFAPETWSFVCASPVTWPPNPASE